METSGGLHVSPRSTMWPLPGAEGPDRRAPFPPTPPGTERPGGSRGEPLTWQPPTQGETFLLLKADVAHFCAPERLEIPGGLHPEPVVGQKSGHVRHGLGTTVLGKKGILGAQTLVLHLPSGGLALSLCGRLLLGPQMQQGGLGRHSHPRHSSGAGSPAFLEEDGALPDQYLVGICGGPNHALCAAGSSQARHYPGHSQTAGPGGHLHQQGGRTSPGTDSMGYFGVSIDETFPPALLELEEGLHHFGQATEAGSCSGHPSGKALQPEVPTGISICSHTSMDGGI